jgi:putative salt-induced outer membrane protein YdiY
MAVVILLAAAAPALAQEAAAPKKWKDAAELSYVQTSGNSKTATTAAKNLFNYDWEKAALELAGGGLGTKSRDTVTAEQYGASEKVSFKLAGKNYAFQKTGWNKDRFAGIKDRWDLGLGLGRHILEKGNDSLFAEVGGGYIFEDRLPGAENKSFGTYRGYAKYIRTLSPTANASQDLEYLGNLKDSKGYRMNAETALVASISTHFSLKASHTWKFVNSPSAGFKKTDTMNSMAIIVNY